MPDLATRLSAARLTLLLDFPFFGQLALRLAPEIDASVDTAATDGRSIKFNPDFCATLTDKELVWLYAHEVAHPALGHLWRFGTRDHERCNVAADYVVNEMLHHILQSEPRAANRMSAIKSALLDRAYFGLSMEQIYDLLQSKGGEKPKPLGTFTKPAKDPSDSPTPSDQPSPNPGDQPSSSPNGQPAPGDQPSSSPNGQPAPGAPSDSLEQEWKAAAAQAATVCRTRNKGHLPGAISDLLTELFEPAVPWQDILRQFVSRICRDDYTFRRPNRRYAHQGIFLPTLRTEGLGTIVVAIDTSGSIRGDSDLLKSFLSELQGILDTTHPEVMHMIDCDCRINSHTEYRSGDDLTGTEFRGGGGTCFRPVFEFVEEHDLQPDCLLYFTDLYGGFPHEEPPYPVLWLNYEDPRNKAPFGQTIHVPRTP